MAITSRQKKIINPYAETTTIPGTKGTGYSYSNERNKFVLDAIHESYLSFFKFPDQGTHVNVPGWTEEEKIITEDDLKAYCALYPQNGRYHDRQIKLVSDQSAEERLTAAVISKLINDGSLEKYSSKTSELTFLPEFEEKQRIANLICVPSDHSMQYRDKLRSSLTLPMVQDSPDLTFDLLPLDPILSVYTGADTNVDIYDWRNNCKPGTQREKVYYNPSDSHYYFTKRTNSASSSAYALNWVLRKVVRLGEEEQSPEQVQAYRQQLWGGLPEDNEAKTNWTEAYNNGIAQILQLTGKNSPENIEIVKTRVGIAPNAVLSYKDVRPGSRWMYAVRIPASVVLGLPAAQGASLPSYEDLELSPLDKAKRIIGNVEEGTPQNNSSMSFSFRTEELVQYLPTIRLLLREYDETLNLLGITPADISGIDLPKEIDRLTSFMDFLGLFFSYNKISLGDKDQIEFFLTDQYVLDHICVNGVFYDRGCANVTYSNMTTQGASLVNAFSLMTPTTFSILKNAFEIQLEYVQTTTSTRIDVLDFIKKYMFPIIDLEAIKKSQFKDDPVLRRKAEKRRHLFQELSRLTKTSPAEYELLFGNRSLTYKISSTLTGVNCDTGQAKAAKYALKFYQAATGKTKLQSLIRETILLIRNELIRDLVEREVISRDTASYANEAARIAAMNPDQILKQVEMFVDQQVFCTLDIVGDFIQNSFLDPLDAPPVANNLIRKTLDVPNLKIDFKKQKMVSLKAETSEVYRRAVKTLIYNFIKSLVAGVAKDIVEALLGCGPDGVKGDQAADLAASAKRYDYGFSDLETLLSAVDIVTIAKDSNIFNVSPDGTKTDPTLTQIEQLLSDTSKMCTPIELQRLLDGDSSSDILEHLLENYTSNRRLSFASKKVGNETIYESLDSRVYNQFVFDTEKIIDFFVRLGNVLDGTASVGELPYQSPLEVYCSSKEPLTSPLTLEFPQPGEIENQIQSIADSRINKINDLCGWLRGMENIQIELERLISNLPIMTWYTDFLEFLTWLSNLVADYLAEKWAALWEKPPLNNSVLPYNMYHSKMGVELFYQIFLELRNLPISEIKNTFAPQGRDLRFPAFVTPPGEGSRPALANWGARSNNPVNEETTIGSAFVRTGMNHSDVSSFIFDHAQYDVNDPNYEAARRGPKRLRLPQYVVPSQKSYEAWDAAYYSMRNAPKPLDNDMKTEFSDPIRSVRTDNQRDVLSRNAEYLFNYLVTERLAAPYIGYVGYSFLTCFEPSLGGIKIHFQDEPTNNLKLLAKYSPMTQGSFHHETTNYQLDTEGNIEEIDYRIFNQGEPLEYEGRSITLSRNNQLLVDDVILPVLSDPDTTRLYGNFSIGNETEEDEDREVPLRERPWQLRGINNYSQRIDETINSVITTNIGKRRLPRYISAINKPCLKQTDEDCVTKEDIKRANAAIQSIQARIQKFLVNVLPCARTYGAWGSMGTTILIVDYLHRKFLKQFKARNILGTFAEAVPYIKEVYPYNPSEDGFEINPIILPENSVEENLKNTIEAVFRDVLKNIGRYSEYKVDDSLFTGSSVTNYRYTLSKFYQAMKRDMERDVQDEDPPYRDYGVPEDNRQAAIQTLESFILNEEDVTNLGLMAGAYYLPIAFQVASYLIFYDHGLKFGDRYSDTHYRAEVEIANADDALVSAIARREINRFSSLFTGYPVSVKTYDTQREIRYYNSNQVDDRLTELRRIEAGVVEEARNFVTIPELEQISIPGRGGQAVELFNGYIQSIRSGLRLDIGRSPSLDDIVASLSDIPEAFIMDPRTHRNQQVIRPLYTAQEPGVSHLDFAYGNLPTFIEVVSNRAYADPIRDLGYSRALSEWFSANEREDFRGRAYHVHQTLGTGLSVSPFPRSDGLDDDAYHQAKIDWWASNEDTIISSVDLEIKNLLQDYLIWAGGNVPQDYPDQEFAYNGISFFGPGRNNFEDDLRRSRIAGYNQITPTSFTSPEYYETLWRIGSTWAMGIATGFSGISTSSHPNQFGAEREAFIYQNLGDFDRGELPSAYRGAAFLLAMDPDPLNYMILNFLDWESNGVGNGENFDNPQLLARAIDWWVSTAAILFFLSFTQSQYAAWETIQTLDPLREEEGILEKQRNQNE